MHKKISKTAIMIYVVSGLLLLSFCLSAYNITIYIQKLIGAGQISISENWFEIMLYYINNTAIYLALAAMLFGMGYIVSYIKKQTVTTAVESEEDAQESVTEEIVDEITENEEVPSGESI